MEQVEVGVILTTEQKRDAIHVAIYPAVAAYFLYPGSHVGFVEEGNTTLVGFSSSNRHFGVVDPFLPMGSVVSPGQKVWVFVYPKTVVQLRHDWNFSGEDRLESSKEIQSNPVAKLLADKTKELQEMYDKINSYDEELKELLKFKRASEEEDEDYEGCRGC